MSIKIGVIADDFTGATDVASFLVQNGFRTVQLSGEQSQLMQSHAAVDALVTGRDVDAVVVSLKNRSNPPSQAVAKALDAHDMLQSIGAEQIYFKYCSTFDSTPEGNIGPVTDALMDRLGVPVTVVCPALPVNGRTTYHGYLFVNGVPLDESGMRNHPVTPMTDASLARLIEAQARGRAGVISIDVIERGSSAVRSAITGLREQGVRYIILDTIHDGHLRVLGEAVADLALVTGGSGLAGAIARARSGNQAVTDSPFGFTEGPSVIVSGSSSERTNEQVAYYKNIAPYHALDVDEVIEDPEAYLHRVVRWYWEQDTAGWAPLVYATADPSGVEILQQRYGAARVGTAIEEFFRKLARVLVDDGVRAVIVAGGETSGAVTTALDISAFEVGPSIAPGVPLVRSLDGRLQLVLKSGNFGSATFFVDAQERA